VSLIFIIGLGGHRYRDLHFSSSLELLSRLPLERPDRIYLSPLILDSNLSYVDAADKHGWDPLDDADVESEMNRWAEAIAKAHPKLQVSLYNIKKFTY